jgi:hypothetical protein
MIDAAAGPGHVERGHADRRVPGEARRVGSLPGDRSPADATMEARVRSRHFRWHCGPARAIWLAGRADRVRPNTAAHVAG